ncbi:MAG TPA: ATP-dependent metallopeptidase FtsH/Yme1/Tma family protein, partial [Acidimicrobiales bacterium]|nr:ATP-dependent metallopeptidase FtsH/Yme1/Tma family protein [Acidimicrobiales bacterium]
MRERISLTMLPPGRQSRWNVPGAGGGSQDGPTKPSRSRTYSTITWLLVAGAFIVALVVFSRPTTPAPQSISYSTFLSKVAHNTVKSISISQSSGVIDGAFRNGHSFTSQGPPGGMPGVDINLVNAHHVLRNYEAVSSTIWSTIITWGILIALMVLFWVWISRRTRSQMAGVTNWSKSRAKVHVIDNPTTTFADIAGYTGVKQEISELVDFLRDPGRFTGIGARIPKGVLLVGPPGTGKTLFARAIAGEAGVPFITITGSEFME